MDAEDEGAGGEEVMLLDDGSSWESDIKTSSSASMKRFEGAILIRGRLTDGDGEEARLEKERRTIFKVRNGDRTRLARLLEERNSTA